MVMSFIWSFIIIASVLWGIVSGNFAALSPGILEGADSAVTLCISICGVTCLWCGIMEVMGECGVLKALSRAVAPVMGWLFPSSRNNTELASAISANAAANFLGLGNAATPMGIQAVTLMDRGTGVATDEMCILIVINTASIQLIPTTVAAVRAAAGSTAPFSILPAVWLTSACSVLAGVAAALILRRIWS